MRHKITWFQAPLIERTFIYSYSHTFSIRVRFWSLDTGALVSILSTGHTDVINSVYSEGNYLFTASDGTMNNVIQSYFR